MRWGWMLTLCLLIGAAASSAAQASCQAAMRHQQCPVGGETFWTSHGCEARNFSLINDETFPTRLGPLNRPQCTGNHFPVYRSFTLAEHSRLEDLVASDGYQSRKDDGYGALAVWLEQELTGRVDSEWHGEMLLYDGMPELFYGRGPSHPTESHKPVMKQALPLLIEAAESSLETGPAYARDHARIAWLLHHTGQRAAALDWMARAERTIGPPPPTDAPWQTQTGFTEATAHLDALALCLVGPEDFRTELCEAGGITSLPYKVINCVSRGTTPCSAWPSWNGDVDQTVAEVRAARESDPRFKAGFDDAMRRVLYSHRHGIPRPSWWATCTLPEALGVPCTKDAQPQWKHKVLEHFPDVQRVLDGDLLEPHVRSLAFRLMQCEFSPVGSGNCDWIPGNLDPRDAAERLKQTWPEFARIYDEQHAKWFDDRATSRGQCLASTKYQDRRVPCSQPVTADGVPSLVPDSAKVEVAFRKALIGGTFAQLPALAQCRLAERTHDPKRCYRSSPFYSLNDTQTLLRADLKDFDALYAAAEAKAVAARAKLIGFELAQRRFWRVSANSHPEIPDYDVRYLNSINRLIALYPEAAALIEDARAETTKRLKTPR